MLFDLCLLDAFANRGRTLVSTSQLILSALVAVLNNLRCLLSSTGFVPYLEQFRGFSCCRYSGSPVRNAG